MRNAPNTQGKNFTQHIISQDRESVKAGRPLVLGFERISSEITGIREEPVKAVMTALRHVLLPVSPQAGRVLARVVMKETEEIMLKDKTYKRFGMGILQDSPTTDRLKA